MLNPHPEAGGEIGDLILTFGWDDYKDDEVFCRHFRVIWVHVPLGIKLKQGLLGAPVVRVKDEELGSAYG